MRKYLQEMALQTVLDQRFEFIATVGKFGFTLGNKPKQQTILLLDIIRLDTLKNVTNHCWIIMQKTLQKIFKKLNVKKGQIIKFSSTVVEYTKVKKVGGVYIENVDYKLDKLKSVRLIS
jgi:hypothetical protein